MAAEHADREAGRSRRGRRLFTHLVAAAAAALIGFIAIISAVSSGGNTDLRPERQSDLADLVESQAHRTAELQARQQDLDKQVSTLTGQVGDSSTRKQQKASAALAPSVGLTDLLGPGVAITLDDAPKSSNTGDVDADALVVHQQDIQAVVNALWAGGAEGVAVQGQRLIATSAIRCVGNSVVIQGVPYPPPYRITAVGDVGPMLDSVARSPAISIYIEYVAKYHLGYDVEQIPSLTLGAFTGSLELRSAQAGNSN
jgi:uncharacterized protein YlxW (UPF0749 family)